jgi:IS5 family transposase
MHQTNKGNQWYFGMKAHIGVDSKEGIVHSVCSTAASVSDMHMLPDLLHGDEKKVWGDAGYQGQTEVIHAAAPRAQDMTSRRVKTKAGVDQEQKPKNRAKARVRAKAEWPFRVLKRVFGFTRVRYRGLKKNHEWICASLALVNLYKKSKSGWPGSLNSWPGKRRSVSAGGRIMPRAKKNETGKPAENADFKLKSRNTVMSFITRHSSDLP